MHAGRAIQRIDANAGIIRQCRQPRVRARMARLCQRIFDERAMRLGGFTDAEARLRNDLDIERRQYGADLVQLADIVRRDDYFFHEFKQILNRKGRKGNRRAFSKKPNGLSRLTLPLLPCHGFRSVSFFAFPSRPLRPWR